MRSGCQDSSDARDAWTMEFLLGRGDLALEAPAIRIIPV